MKKKIVILLYAVVLLLVGIAVWYNVPIDLMNLDHNEVKGIEMEVMVRLQEN